MLPFILLILDISIDEGAEILVNYVFNVLVLNIILLLSFTNIIGYFLSLHLIQKMGLMAFWLKERT